MKFTLYREQQLNCDIDTAWQFFSSPMNLSKITPKEVGFTIVSNFENEEIHENMMIDYIVTPILNIPLKWRTIITTVEKNKNFTDFQSSGPYKYWNHRHDFIENDKGVLMKDTVIYELPLGILGILAHKLFVKNKLIEIFDFRFQILEKLFNESPKE